MKKSLIALFLIIALCLLPAVNTINTQADVIPMDGEYYNDSYTEYEPAFGETFAASWYKWLIIAVVIGCVVGLIRIAVLKGELKSAVIKTEASDYIRDGSFNVSGKKDYFLYKKVERTERKDASQ